MTEELEPKEAAIREKDRSRKDGEDGEGFDVDLGQVVYLAFLASLSFSAVILGPLPVIVAQNRLDEPWPKVVALAGAILAIVFLGSPPATVLGFFILSILVAHFAHEGMAFYSLLLLGSALGMGFFGAALVFLATSIGAKPLVYWTSTVETVLTEIRTNPTAGEFLGRSGVSEILMGPQVIGVVGAMSLFLVWLSMGAAAHFRIVRAEGAPWSGEWLRRVQISVWPSFVFFGLVVVDAWMESVSLTGLTNLAGTVLFAQGFIFLSRVLKRVGLGSVYRTAIYLVSVVVGFPALMALGFSAPFLASPLKNGRRS